MIMKQLLGRTTEELREDLRILGQPSYRAVQLQQWLYQNVPFEDMLNLPKSLRDSLRNEYSEGYAKVLDRQKSQDGTTKYLMQLSDGNTVETVFLPHDYGNTLCISTQVGCAMGCKFCASCRDGLIRNLTAGEMLAQITAVNADQQPGKVNRIVLMGMGEPLQNTDAVLRFLRMANDPDGLGISQRNVSISTCGVVDQMDRLANEGVQATLAVSLHAPDQAKRETLMPSARKYELHDIIEAAKRYYNKTGRRVTFEYALIHGVNDSQADLNALARLLRPLHTHVNVIPLNGTIGNMRGPSKRDAYAFADRLTKMGVPATVRRSMGRDIEGACGQLRQRFINSEVSHSAKSAGCGDAVLGHDGTQQLPD